MNTRPRITGKQQELIRLIYRHRFLERVQIQALLHHSDKRRISSWLKDLREKSYIEWTYDASDPIERNKPAIYHIALNGIRFLKSLDDYPVDELRKRYAEGSRKRTFIDRCLLLAGCCVDMEACSANDDNLEYEYTTLADYAEPDNEYHFLCASEFIRPNLVYSKEETRGQDTIVTTTLVEVNDSTLPRHSLKKRLADYISFLESDEWQEGTGDGTLPVIAFVCPTKAELVYAKRRIVQLLQDIYGDDDYISEDIRIRVTTVDLISRLGLTGSIWEEL